MPSQFEGTFDRDRPEWTARKHKVIDHYLKVALYKLSKFKRPILLVDGYAGANEYNGEIIGSTVLMARKASSMTNVQVTVAACEVDDEHYERMISNLKTEIADGIVKPYKGTHSQNLRELLKLADGKTAVIFLDPERPRSIGINEDIVPWCQRGQVTDVLGLFFPGAVSRMSGNLDEGSTRDILERYLGQPVDEYISEDQAMQIFQNKLQHLMKYCGMYAMRKVSPKKIVYGIYGLSNSIHGFWLLSDAVARDYDDWKGIVGKDQTGNLFEHDPSVSVLAELAEELVSVGSDVLRREPGLDVEDFAHRIFERSLDRNRYFGQFKESSMRKIKSEAQRRLLGE